MPASSGPVKPYFFSKSALSDDLPKAVLTALAARSASDWLSLSSRPQILSASRVLIAFCRFPQARRTSSSPAAERESLRKPREKTSRTQPNFQRMEFSRSCKCGTVIEIILHDGVKAISTKTEKVSQLAFIFCGGEKFR